MGYTGLYVEDFSAVDIHDIRRAVGGRRKLRQLEEVDISLRDERIVTVKLVRSRTNIGNGFIIDFLCPGCGRRVRVLRVVPGAEGLVCRQCLNKKFGARYKSQERHRKQGDDTGLVVF